jgi:hypothetical protein
MYKLHTVDIYFWTKEDAQQFFNGIRRVLPQQQILVEDEPLLPPSHEEEMSPIVQKLENVAITDPSYQGGRTRDSRTTSTKFTRPPISATPQSEEASNFAPMAYNPAAPAAPEVIRHREKTPPPEDGAANPLMAAATSDQGQTFGIPYQGIGFSGPPGQLPQQGYISTQPASAPPAPFSQPPSSTVPQSPFAHHFQNTFAPPPTLTTKDAPYAQPPPAYQPQQQPQTLNQFANYPGSPSVSSDMNTSGPYSTGFSAPATESTAAPPGGFAQYQYTKVSNTQPLMNDYSIHQQVYRPTEVEAASHGHKHKSGKTPAAGKPPRGKLEDRADKLERGVGSLLKKLEKKIG